MAIINSYPLATPKLTDLVLGTSTSSTGQTSTKSFTVQSIKNTTAGVQTITTTIPATLNITGSGTANVTIDAVTAAITSGGAALATGGDIYTFLTGKITGTPNTVPIWTDATTLGNSLISQANNGVIINGNSTDGKLTLNCSVGTHGVTLQSPPHSSGATYTWILPQSAGTAGQVLTSGGGATDQLTWSTNGNVGGTGTTNKLSKWSNANTLADSNIEDTGTLVTISSAAKVTGDLELDADLIDVNGSTGSDGQLLKSLGGGNLGVEWINAPATGVLTVTDGNTIGVNEGITIAGTTANPTVAASIGAVSSSSFKLATGAQIQTAIDTALAGAITFKGTFNANTGQITGTSDYLYNPGANTNTIAVAVGDMYVVNVAGNFFGNSSTALNVGDEVIAVTQSTISPSNSQESYYNAVPSAGGGITGGGTTNKVPLWTGTTALGDSVIAQSGTNIGIGTTSPNAALEVHNTLNIGDGTSVTSIGLQRNSANYITATDAAGYLVFRTGGANERMRIDSSGNVGIGVIPKTGGPTWQHVQFGGTGNLIARKSDSTIDSMFANNSYVNSSNVDSYITTGAAARLFLNDNEFSFDNAPSGTTDGPISFTTRMIIDSSGQIQFNEYTSASSFTGTAAANLAVDSSGNIITEASGGGGGGTKTVNQITVANATTGTITLSVSPTNENYTDMYVSGVYQNKSTYTLSGSTITLDGGAYFPNGAVVEVVSTT